MNKLISHISLVIVAAIVVLTCWQSYTVVHFYTFQDEIEAEFCENLDRPELECHGQCHLKKQLSAKVLKVDKKTRIIQSSLLVFQAFDFQANYQNLKFNLNNSSYFHFSKGLIEGAGKSILDPPELIS